MNPLLKGIQPKEINIEKGVFESCGTFYYINLEGMAYARLKRFAELMPTIIYGKSYFELANFIHELRVKMTTGEETLKQTYIEVASAVTKWDMYVLENATTFNDATIDNVLRFCALFIVEQNEDLTKIDDILIEKKVENWKKDMDLTFFFKLKNSQLPKYQALLETLLAEKTREELSPLKIPSN